MNDRRFNTEHVVNQRWFERLGMQLLVWIIMLLMLTTVFFIYEQYEADWFPVVKNFQVDEFKDVEDGIEISGTMEKKRNCQIESVNAYGTFDKDNWAVPLNIQFLDTEVSNRSPLAQRWGPWKLYVPGEFKQVEVTILSTHSCAFSRTLNTKLVTFLVMRDDGSLSMMKTIDERR